MAVEAIAPALIDRYGGQIMATARCYSHTPEDAEDAYQRGLEVLLTKAPSTDLDVLVPWLKTVVKHEAFALGKQRRKHGFLAERNEFTPAAVDTHEHVERLDRLRRGAEALGRLKDDETRCMLLLAEGHSYAEICEVTGFSYTKVNRCLTEGRRSFLERVARIESGAECERMLPLLSALADGEAGARDLAILRPHLRTCLTCRAALREAREVPARVAALAPVGLIAAAAPADGGGAGIAGAFRSAAGWVNERITAVVVRGQDVIEAASTHKLAAAAASVAALGGGGVATVEMAGPHPAHYDRVESRVVAARPPAAAPAWRPAASLRPGRPSAPVGRHNVRRRPRPVTHAPTTRSAPPPKPAVEPAAAAPATRPRAAAPSEPKHSPPKEPGTGEFGP